MCVFYHLQILGLLYSIINRFLLSNLIFSKKSSHLQILGDSRRDLNFEFSQWEPFTTPYLIRLMNGFIVMFNVIYTRFNSMVRSFEESCARIVAVCAWPPFESLLARPKRCTSFILALGQRSARTRCGAGVRQHQALIRYILSRALPSVSPHACYALPTHSYPEMSTRS